MSPDNKLRFKVTVSQAYPALLEAMNQGKPYYRSRRLVELASLGLWFEENGFTAVPVSVAKQTSPVVPETTTSLASGPNPPPPFNEEPDKSETHYSIPDDPDALKELFGYLNNK